ncbi:hypothetical protein BCR32DRAFT_245730 [Anaeromyces robustus]|uniref:Transmembrane protein n=1 Tax=Anaeromyces robustus TaxID=1754192 RepID=A0A1Y1X4R9_9FUNG|nr:hypothetical protein BCR32DRAFT_245730 [Anaeromyces robustus]|eukprot:ORX80314.1 hypothetical protein BCR32DRAFT_245730 [Anaeromyces robustus]
MFNINSKLNKIYFFLTLIILFVISVNADNENETSTEESCDSQMKAYFNCVGIELDDNGRAKEITNYDQNKFLSNMCSDDCKMILLNENSLSKCTKEETRKTGISSTIDEKNYNASCMKDEYGNWCSYTKVLDISEVKSSTELKEILEESCRSKQCSGGLKTYLLGYGKQYKCESEPIENNGLQNENHSQDNIVTHSGSENIKYYSLHCTFSALILLTLWIYIFH